MWKLIGVDKLLPLFQVFDRLHKLGISMTHKSTVRLLNKLGEHHDSIVHVWKEAIQSWMDSTRSKVI